MAMEINTDKAICTKCGIAYGRHKGYFPVSYSLLYKGTGYMPICRKCLDDMYNAYLAECNNQADAVRQMCRKLDLYWSDEIFRMATVKSANRSTMTSYIAKINTVTYAGKSYDDTLKKEDILWNFKLIPPASDTAIQSDPEPIEDTEDTLTMEDIANEVKDFWGAGYTADMYAELEKRYSAWVSRFPKNMELDIGTEALIKQICALEMDINRDRAQGKSVDKNVTVLNTLLGSANLKPVQRQNNETEADAINNPLGVWIYRYEHQRPLPEIDDELKDVNGLLRYIFVWMGHLFKMLGKKCGFTKMYEEEIERLKIERPEFADEEEEDFLMDALDTDADGGDEE